MGRRSHDGGDGSKASQESVVGRLPCAHQSEYDASPLHAYSDSRSRSRSSPRDHAHTLSLGAGDNDEEDEDGDLVKGEDVEASSDSTSTSLDLDVDVDVVRSHDDGVKLIVDLIPPPLSRTQAQTQAQPINPSKSKAPANINTPNHVWVHSKLQQPYASTHLAEDFQSSILLPGNQQCAAKSKKSSKSRMAILGINSSGTNYAENLFHEHEGESCGRTCLSFSWA